MPRVKKAVKSRQRRKQILDMAKGYRGGRGTLLRSASETVDRALKFAYRDRKARKRSFRSLWIMRINAAARLHGLSYSKFMNGLSRANVSLDRKALANLAVSDPDAFAKLAQLAKEAA
ncbi:50S ribosomal protein L20 [Desulforhabdus amnigena]|jgi:large subunit ribosomal protein L20|uniref:Large ribosomal subunit protein bL20 n=1 Tax=Desulforhabdus amnigena TaxID=40218 RepID=A0A9W6FS23_9BACT|nr:50S ribosomal protein L20 [Desulforhabdus amnigena]NLJ27055.1 50S ribosomal protein L20 [Deltaproteobacteria bacterium]GLI34142.1 50S ribosomal protein L20 [Desulforhabdus amnigena]